ncbi:MAG: DUF3466 family protein [Anaerohalosphaera sp.]|nr:DUF3466 family protein [Anaerohalosphaera sp.]
MHKTFSFLLLTITVCLSLSQYTYAVEYTITDIGPGNATCINNDGYIGGSFGIWYDGSIIDGSMSVVDINESGNAIARASYNRHIHSYYREKNGSWVDIGTLGGAACWASGINNSNQIVGTSQFFPYSYERPFLYENGNMTDLDTNIEGHFHALDINDSGQVLCRKGGYRFVWEGGDTTIINSLGGTSTWLLDINNHGQVVGSSATIPGRTYTQRPFLYDPSIGTIDLGIYGGNEGRANSINEFGQIVGAAGGAFLYQDGETIYLNDFLTDDSPFVNLLSANGINDRGQIVGVGYLKGSYDSHAFLLTPIPEPATMLLLGVGAIAIRRRRV